jgi:hypothetical protein
MANDPFVLRFFMLLFEVPAQIDGKSAAVYVDLATIRLALSMAAYEPIANNLLQWRCQWRLSQRPPLSRLRRMRDLTRRFLFLLFAVVFFTGAAAGLAVHGAAAGESCAEHHDDTGNAAHHHDGAEGNCLTCCMGICVAIPDLPPRFFSMIVPMTTAKVAYWDRGTGIAGRTIPPDPIPPRLSA